MELKGFSGCELEIIDVDEHKCVRKRSSSIDYNHRMLEQKRKQSDVHIGDLNNCRVIDEGNENGLYYFDMEYINGMTLADYMESIELSDIDQMVFKLTNHYSMYTERDDKASGFFCRKVSDVKNAIYNNSIVKRDNDTIQEAINELEHYSWKYVVNSPCHGDMTMENILIDKDGCYLIDFLDSFYDTWQIDAAKLLQDAECYWSYRYKPMTMNLKVRLLIFRDLCIEKIMKMQSGKDFLDSVYHILLLNILRIFPYVKNERDYLFLVGTLSNINKKMGGH